MVEITQNQISTTTTQASRNSAASAHLSSERFRLTPDIAHSQEEFGVYQ